LDLPLNWLGVVIYQAVYFLLQPIKPVEEHLGIGSDFRTGDMVTSHFFSGSVEENPQPLKFSELLFHNKTQYRHDPSQDHIPDEHFHDLTLPCP